ncbi:MAG: hypothetical protein CMM67_04700 [Rhodospirillaceae bacterium]|nr:hypothetical protein [Rhodospirillaceae bacterium]OUT78988.1 MAG: hypothetical protein CBB83_04885 [Rhodospirillaceae bacterium TMED23]|tara:strand:- start:2527 stop:2865 length:339 start_codon:yes stop_codon:yes gene_type:complete
MLRLLILFGTMGVINGCTNQKITSYESLKQEPMYCYQTLAAVQCYKDPHPVDFDRLVYFRGDAPIKKLESKNTINDFLKPPTEKNGRWVKDPEPLPMPRVREKGVLKTVNPS